MGWEHQRLLIAVVGAALLVTQAGRFYLGVGRGGMQPLLIAVGIVAVAGLVAGRNWGRRLLMAVMGLLGAGAVLQLLRPPRLVNALLAVVALGVAGWLLMPGIRSQFTLKRRNWGMARVTSGMLLLVAKAGTWVSPREAFFQANNTMEATGMLLGGALSVCFAIWLVWSGIRIERAAPVEAGWN
jgi:hypothetical protein